ncbi:oligosaccharide flippase family protein [Leuconostoc suionicum]|uniref:lipopolysaccharide biosynthesis protein n=2 Tax=Leuconostoc suionicum TaxID=1511761 RepID=UPI0024ACCCD4|nr:oligosaccharide flippase family protein [Leuconostoc suionicum]MDI6498664.1 oligosaccharide flippase family protein [Leuconostoc suionicum]MDI6502830.1 oligosaccharide flippase family protein [Leuconostoc suionicum]MDI6614792.1 oligosaccharide flippase family protein [Leuconostoc suionicum]MDI6665689.1 oligosaccharide flippase family protein [Leuconostoc suionicum]
MNRYKKLLGNSVVIAIGNLGSKLITFLLVPFYTYTLTKVQFGTVDLLTTSVNMLLPIVTLSTFDAVFRFAMDKSGNKDVILTNGIIISLAGSAITALLVPVLAVMHVSMPIYIYFLLVSSAFVSLLLNFSRAIDQIKTYAFSGILGTVLIAIANIVLLWWFKTGVQGYIISMILSNSIVIIFLCCMIRIWKKVRFQYASTNLMKKMMFYSVPLIPNAFSWWVNSSADRYFILAFVGAGANGLYAVANKIPSLLNILNQVFFQSWQMSAVEEFDSEDASTFYSKTFNYFLSFQFIGAAGLLLMLKPLMKIIVSSSYYIAWEYIPFLLMAVIYSSLSGFLGTTYTAAKRTAGIFLTTLVGAISNILLGFIFVPWLGIQGASFAGFLSFAIVLGIRLIDTKRFMPVIIDKKNFILNHFIISIMIIVLFLSMNFVWEQVVELFLFSLIMVVNRNLFIEVWHSQKNKK